MGLRRNVTVEAGATQMTLRAGKGATSKAIIWTRVEYVRGELAIERPNWGLVACCSAAKTFQSK